MKMIFTLALIPMLFGCAYLRSTTKDPVWGTAVSGGFTNATFMGYKKTTVRAYAIFDAHSDLMKFRNSTGATGTNGFVIAPGTSIGSLDQFATSTNVGPILGDILGYALRAYTGGGGGVLVPPAPTPK
jgi:hypothetical protein